MPRLDSTIGIDPASEKILRSFAELAPPATAADAVDLSIWDFAGQIEYSSTHQFFITPSRTVVLLLVDVSSPVDQQRRHLAHWVDMLCSLMPRPTASGVAPYRVQLVLSKADLLSPTVASARAADLFHEAKRCAHLRWTESVLRISNKSGAGVKKLAEQVQLCASQVLNDMSRSALVPKYVRAIFLELTES